MAAILGPLISDKKLNFEQYLGYSIHIGIIHYKFTALHVSLGGVAQNSARKETKKKNKINIAATNIA